MMQLGNLAIVAANHNNCMLQIYDNEVTVYVGHGPDRESITSKVNDDEPARGCGGPWRRRCRRKHRCRGPGGC